MNDLRMKADGYRNVTSYDAIINALKDFLLQSDITYVSLWSAFFIVVGLASLIIIFKKKHDELFSFPNDISFTQVNRHLEILSNNEEWSRVINYKHLLTQLHYITSKCHDNCYASKCIRLVRDCPYLINITLEPSGLTPFQRVCYNGHTCLVEYMLAKGGNPLLTTQAGENALCLAIYHFIKYPQDEDLSCLDVLFESGCTLNPKSRWFRIILKMAAQGCNKRLTEWILVHANSTVHEQRSMSVPAAFQNIKRYSQNKPSRY